MTSTERLRAMLDERGESYVENDFGITWSYYSDPHTATESMDGTLIVTGLTPKQAIAATLGAGTCHDTGDPSDFCCSECGVRMFTDTNETYTMIASDGRTIIKRPNYCPNCGKRVVEVDE